MNSKIIITSGDSHGIGPEIILKSFNKDLYSSCIVIGSKRVFDYYIKKFNFKITVNYISVFEKDFNSLYVIKNVIKKIIKNFNPKVLNIIDFFYKESIQPGIFSKYSGFMALFYIQIAIKLIKMNFSKFLLTAPVNKNSIILNDKNFIGHTEYLAQNFNVPKVTMLMFSEKIKIALVSTHIPLISLTKEINIESTFQTIKQANYFLMKIHSNRSKIAVCGLNPHAGEGGCFGHEEEEIIIPAIKKAKMMGINVYGPFSSDTLFCTIYDKNYDLYIAMYHDQGLIPFKLISFSKGLNITLGLPFIRISVDHGTAYNIADKGIANSSSFLYALKWILEFNGDFN